MVRGQVFSATRPSEGGPASVTRIDPGDGSEQWQAEIDVSGSSSLEMDPTGTVLELVDETSPGVQRRTVLDTDSGSVLWPGSDDHHDVIDHLDIAEQQAL